MYSRVLICALVRLYSIIYNIYIVESYKFTEERWRVSSTVSSKEQHNSHTTGCKSQLTGCFPFRTPSFPNGRSCLRHVTIGFDRETNKFLLCSKEFDSLDLLVAFFKVRNSNHNWIYCLHTQTIEQIRPRTYSYFYLNYHHQLTSCLTQTYPTKAAKSPGLQTLKYSCSSTHVSPRRRQ